MKTKMTVAFLVLSLSILSSCDIFPYVNQPTPQPSPSVTSTQPSPTLLSPSATIQNTPTPTNSQGEITATVEPTSTQTPSPYRMQAQNPFYLENFNHPVKGCQWMGVAGQVFDLQGEARLGLTIRVGGLKDEPDFLEATTGLVIAYGPGGYEITLGDSPVDSSQTYWIQIIDEDGTVITEKYYFSTYNDCTKNLIVLNFVAEDISVNKAPAATPTVPAYP